MPTAIEFNHVSKQYRLGLVSTRTLSHDLDRWWKMNILGKEDPYLKIGETNDRATKGESDYVWALKDIDFKVEQGDVVGIIGKNGAGKSTLLKLLSKVTGPTTGTIKARGRIGALLEVGTGFHQEMTGRENIYLNGAILGMSHQEIAKKLDEIVDFSGCERYIDTPVKRYSSGMMVRLGFAVAAHLDPEILVVDEVLAVGDAEFQKKAIGKMQDVSKGEGRTVLFVSHNMASIATLCTKGALLDRGSVTFSGSAKDTISRYLNDCPSEDVVSRVSIRPLTSRIHIYNFTINGADQNIVKVSSKKNTIDIKICGSTDGPMKIAIEARLYDQSQFLLGVFSPSHINGYAPEFNGDFSINEHLTLPANMNKGKYYLKIELSHPNVEFLARADMPIILNSEGVIGKSGLTFDYSGSGFLML